MSDNAPNVLLLAGHLSAAGAGSLRSRLARLEHRGIRAGVVCLSVHDPRGWTDSPASAAEPPRFVACPALGNPWRRPWAVRELTGEHGTPRPTLIHALGVEMAGPALALAERWRVFYLLGLEEFLPVGARLRLSRSWCRGLVAPGSELADDLVRSLGLPRRAITVLRPGFVPEEERRAEEPGLRSGRLAVVGSASRLTSGSGLATFLQAARLVLDSGRDAEFLIAGRGPSETPLRRLAESLGVSDRVTFADDAADYPPFWRVLDLFCLTSLTPTTGHALALALAHGVPSIASAVPGLDDLLDDGRSGLLIPPGDPEALAGAINGLLDDPSRSLALGRSGRQWITEHHDPEREADDLASLYRRSLAPEPSFGNRRRVYRADHRAATP